MVFNHDAALTGPCLCPEFTPLRCILPSLLLFLSWRRTMTLVLGVPHNDSKLPSLSCYLIVLFFGVWLVWGSLLVLLFCLLDFFFFNSTVISFGGKKWDI